MRVTIKPNATTADMKLIAEAQRIAERYKTVNAGTGLERYLLRRSNQITDLLGYDPIS